MSLRMISAQIETAAQLSKYKKNIETVKKMDLALSILYPTPQIGPYIVHPKFNENSTKFLNNIANFEGSKPGTIAFGDSILAMYRERWRSIPELFDFAVGGFWSHHMLNMAQIIKPALDSKGIMPANIVIGSLGGNPLLLHQEINSVIQKSYECLDTLRSMWPYARLIVYGLPPTIATYATLHSLEFETALYKWVVQDKGASVFIPMQKGFAGKWGIFPKTSMTADGVHLSPVGMVLLDNRIEKAKKATIKTMVDYSGE